MHELTIEIESLLQHRLRFVPEITPRRRADHNLAFPLRCGNQALPIGISIGGVKTLVAADKHDDESKNKSLAGHFSKLSSPGHHPHEENLIRASPMLR
ncbi:MAG TPA: hypothetical protein VF130_00990 [Candidatus Binatia bacterium]